MKKELACELVYFKTKSGIFQNFCWSRHCSKENQKKKKTETIKRGKMNVSCAHKQNPTRHQDIYRVYCHHDYISIILFVFTMFYIFGISHSKTIFIHNCLLMVIFLTHFVAKKKKIKNKNVKFPCIHYCPRLQHMLNMERFRGIKIVIFWLLGDGHRYCMVVVIFFTFFALHYDNKSRVKRGEKAKKNIIKLLYATHLMAFRAFFDQ